jgi:hypothetical protein
MFCSGFLCLSFIARASVRLAAESPRLFVEPGFFRTLDLHDHAVLNYCKYRAKSQSLESLADPGEGGILRDRVRRTGGGSVGAAWAA